MQLNKRDLSGERSVQELSAALGTGDLPIVEAAAPVGIGVFDTVKTVTRLMLLKHREKLSASG